MGREKGVFGAVEGMKERNEGFYGPDYLSNVLSLRSIHISKASHLSLSLFS